MSEPINVNGANSYSSYQGKIDIGEVVKDEETCIFPTERPTDIDKIPKLEIPPEVFEKIKDKILGEEEDVKTEHKDADFTEEEADAYAKGEAEIEKMVQKELLRRGILMSIGTGALDINEIEKECREKYAEEHPEYKAVMEEGLAVEEAHDEAIEKEKKEWLNDNPPPPMFNNTNPLGTGGFKISEEYKEWQAEMEKHMEYVEKKYSENNPDYANLKDAKAEHKNVPIWKATL